MRIKNQQWPNSGYAINLTGLVRTLSAVRDCPAKVVNLEHPRPVQYLVAHTNILPVFGIIEMSMKNYFN